MRNIVPFVLICLLIIYAINVYELFLTYYNSSHDDNINQCRNLYTDSYHHEKNNLIFLKTHKTASSTVTRILWRQLCDVDNRRCFLPPSSNAGRIWNINDKDDKRIIHEKGPHEVWLHHAYYSDQFLDIILDPKLLLSIVRRPSLRFRSAWVWYEHQKTLDITLEKFVHIIKTSYIYIDCYIPFLNTNAKCHKFKYRTGLDATSEELVGYPKTSMWFKSKHDQLIKNIYERKIFILVADRLDESLLVLGKLVGLKMTSLLYASQKVLASKNDNGHDKDILRDLDKLQPYDLKLYKAANSMLDCYIKDYHHHHHHEQFEDDLYSFRIANERVHAFCQMVHTNNNNNEKLDTKLPINTTTIGDKRVRYREYCQRLYSDNDEAISQIWEWKENVKRNISDISVAKIKALSDIDLSFLLTSTRFPS